MFVLFSLNYFTTDKVKHNISFCVITTHLKRTMKTWWRLSAHSYCHCLFERHCYVNVLGGKIYQFCPLSLRSFHT